MDRILCERNEEMGLCADPTCPDPPTADEMEFSIPDAPGLVFVARFCVRHHQMVNAGGPKGIALIPDRSLME